jgi:hypothetical protein
MAYINTEIEKVIAKGNSSNKLLELWSNLQWACALYFNSEVPGVPMNLKFVKNKPSRSLN